MKDTRIAEAVSIARRTGNSEFDRLVKQGVELAQQYAGESWTDYNVHDPGRTILEHLCYGLTELSYKADFPVEDYLCDRDGNIALDALGLKAPEVILPCRPVTETDYRKILLDRVPGLRNLQLDHGKADDLAGLYRITLMLAERADAEQQTRIEEAVRQVYCQQRNLCEDIADIAIAPAVDCELHAHIEVAGNLDFAELLARVYFESERCLSQEISSQHYAEVLQENEPDAVLRGPWTEKRFIADKALTADNNGIDLLDLIAAINGLDGVHEVKDLSLTVNGHSYRRFLGYAELAEVVGKHQLAVPHLFIPETPVQIKVTLSKDGRPLVPDVDGFRSRFDALQFQHRHREQQLQDLGQLLPAPGGQYHDLQRYVSIQNDFPDNYNINAYGLPDSAAPAEKARAAQLKAYLLLFDQVMANFGVNLQNLRKLFSPQTGEQVSWWAKPLDQHSAPGVAELYKRSSGEVLAEIVQRYDNFNDRKSRLLDYLLALYGEKFTQTALRQISPAADELTEEERLVKNKVRLLEHIVAVNRDRSGGDDYLEDLWGDAPARGLKLKSRILLGTEHLQDRPLSSTENTDGFHLVEHLLLRPEGVIPQHSCKLPDDFYPFRISVIFPAWTTRGRQHKYRHLAEETIVKNCPAHVYPEFYWLARDRMGAFESLYQHWAAEKKNWRPGKPFDDLDRAAAKLVDFLVAAGGGAEC